ncbi:UDP-2,3-diacylglucosamine diphosphatase LpxI [Akkermansiaceae bacterium]|nr:UDP-2,3-diacylglucosamine diphosphatase LpxI [Akkermansiaceae bacterium]
MGKKLSGVSTGQRTIGVIAGNGMYPETFINAAKKEGVKLVVAAFKGETKEGLGAEVDVLDWFRVGQLGGIIKYFKKNGVEEAIMVGQIAPRNLFDLWPDLRTLKVLHSVKQRNAESLFGGIASEFGKDGIDLLPATTFLEDQMATEGEMFGPKLSDRGREDVAYGFSVVKQTSALDIGQSIVVRHGTVLAVEAFEGTDACIKRGGELGNGKEVTLVKVSKPDQDMRFDVPVVGPKTIESCREAGVKTIAVEANKTLILGSDEVKAACEAGKITLVGVS